MLIARVSPLTGKETIMDLDITEDQVWAYRNGALLQDAFPNLTADQREFFKTGYTAEDWELMFGSDEEFEEEA
jgi:hypothetical protein